MSPSSLATDPALLATFDRVCQLVMAAGSGITLKELGFARALAEAWVQGDRIAVEDHARRLEIDPATLGER